MINFWIALRNPLWVRPFRMVWCRQGQIHSHKFWELQVSRYAFNWLEVSVDLNWRQTDHAGPSIMIGILGWQFDARIVDDRHWNNGSNNWAQEV